MRVLKEPEERRNEILDAAYELFFEKGYDNTSVLDILEKVGIAKGTLYYYFKSKEDIMDAIIERIIAKMLSKANAIVLDDSLSVHEKLLRTLMSLHLNEEKGQMVMDHIHNPQNARLHKKQLDAITHGVTPILTLILEEGIAQGLFSTPFPYESAEMLLIYSEMTFDHPEGNIARKIAAFICNMERILGAEKNSFSYMTQLFN
ncbi:TetR/AcrR family transcriptional regulator [uncultured Sphaerochaeta sp.]|uniref:TetR/AcrR family transcriptional regulator n=1 Tax=uncultured Sphaerochaeta sp. TaxID=886478 RepID=UPI002A0A1A96|nr:TetR/AcrR family transcriptional regulator [uncultured Sphaerochaeta sp.]